MAAVRPATPLPMMITSVFANQPGSAAVSLVPICAGLDISHCQFTFDVVD